MRKSTVLLILIIIFYHPDSALAEIKLIMGIEIICSEDGNLKLPCAIEATLVTLNGKKNLPVIIKKGSVIRFFTLSDQDEIICYYIRHPKEKNGKVKPSNKFKIKIDQIRKISETQRAQTDTRALF
ncbi:hypothetical protein C4569_02855 [Candidatus Parcubacteria bacterium]|nr:MAG: hypothetical protein C4569_02855 [Candidatus Parcubacteria bacterium]